MHVEAIVADTEAARRLHYHLRYQVFCLETGFEDAAVYPEEEEKDEFDDRAVHFLVRDKDSGTWLAAARLVLPGKRTLPVEHHCELFRDELSKTQPFPLERTGEVSRLLLTKGIRRRREDTGLLRRDPPGAETRSRPPAQERRSSHAVLKELLLGIAAYCRSHDIPQTAFFVTPGLARILGRLGIKLSAIGDPCQHRGHRFPYVADVEQVYQALKTPAEDGESGDGQARPYRLFSRLDIPASNEGKTGNSGRA